MDTVTTIDRVSDLLVFCKGSIEKFLEVGACGDCLRKKVARVNMHVTGHSEKFDFL
jgi:hypothetical protein